MDNETKYASLYNVKAANNKDRVIEFTATKEIVDYDNEVVKVDGLDISNIKKNKSFLWSHQYSSLPIGKILNIKKDGNQIVGTAQLTSEEEYPFGYSVYKLIKGGYINNVSIGFKPDYNAISYKQGKDGSQVRIYNKATLMEVSAVNVGANRMATVSAKSIEDLAEKAFNEQVLDQNELENFYNELKKQEAETVKAEVVNLEKENKELKLKVEELEQKVSYLEEEIKEFESNDEYTEMLKDFKSMVEEDHKDVYDRIIDLSKV